MSETIRVCFVCLGNICRSPTAEGVMRHLLRGAALEHRVFVQSAGTGGWHVGERPDPRTLAAARKRGVALESRARQFQGEHFAELDYVLAMDRDNLRVLHGLARDTSARDKVHLFRDFDPAAPRGSDVPDPYYGGEQGFDEVFDLVTAAAQGFLRHLVERHGLTR